MTRHWMTPQKVRYFALSGAVVLVALALNVYAGDLDTNIQIETGRVDFTYVRPTDTRGAAPLFDSIRVIEVAFAGFTAITADEATLSRQSDVDGQWQEIPSAGAVRIEAEHALSKAIFSDVFIDRLEIPDSRPRISLVAAKNGEEPGFVLTLSGPFNTLLAKPRGAESDAAQEITFECQRCRIGAAPGAQDSATTAVQTLRVSVRPSQRVQVAGRSDQSIVHVTPAKGALDRERFTATDLSFCEGPAPTPRPSVRSAKVSFPSIGQGRHVVGGDARPARSATIVVEPRTAMTVEKLTVTTAGATGTLGMELSGKVNRVGVTTDCNTTGDSLMPSYASQLQSKPGVAAALGAMALLIAAFSGHDKLERLWRRKDPQ